MEASLAPPPPPSTDSATTAPPGQTWPVDAWGGAGQVASAPSLMVCNLQQMKVPARTAGLWRPSRVSAPCRMRRCISSLASWFFPSLMWSKWSFSFRLAASDCCWMNVTRTAFIPKLARSSAVAWSFQSKRLSKGYCRKNAFYKKNFRLFHITKFKLFVGEKRSGRPQNWRCFSFILFLLIVSFKTETSVFRNDKTLFNLSLFQINSHNVKVAAFSLKNDYVSYITRLKCSL